MSRNTSNRFKILSWTSSYPYLWEVSLGYVCVGEYSRTPELAAVAGARGCYYEPEGVREIKSKIISRTLYHEHGIPVSYTT